MIRATFPLPYIMAARTTGVDRNEEIASLPYATYVYATLNYDAISYESGTRESEG